MTAVNTWPVAVLSLSRPRVSSQNRYEQLNAKLTAERELSERTMRALDEQNLQLREARASLQAAEADAQIMRARASRLADTGA